MVGGVFWKSARIGERLSPYIGLCCVIYAVSSLGERLSVQKLMLAGPSIRSIRKGVGDLGWRFGRIRDSRQSWYLGGVGRTAMAVKAYGNYSKGCLGFGERELWGDIAY